MLRRIFLLICICSAGAFAQMPPIEPGVSKSLAEWRAAHYSDVRYKLNLTLEKMSPVLKGSIEVRVNISAGTQAPSPASPTGEMPPIILDWRRIKGHEAKSVISNVVINGTAVSPPSGDADRSVRTPVEEHNEHLIFRDGVKLGENVIKLDFTSPILTSGAGITRYIDKEDGSEYIYSLFVPSDASTAFPVFDQPDLKARFQVNITAPDGWNVVSNSLARDRDTAWSFGAGRAVGPYFFAETKPISTYVFAFAAGPFERVTGSGVSSPHVSKGSTSATDNVGSQNSTQPRSDVGPSLTVGLPTQTDIYVRRSQAAKFQPHAAEVFRLNRESIKYFEGYFDYKFPFPKYDLVLIPEFPFGGMEHAGATFLRESAIIFPQEPTKSDHISRAVLIFHEAAHQWFGDTVTMKWFDDLWLKEGFANFMAYKALEKIKLGGGNPTGREGVSVNIGPVDAWKVFYERIKQPAYATDSTRGTTPIYQPIDNLNSAKSAYGNIVYNKAPAFLKQAEFYLGPDKFQIAVRAFLKKHEYKNATWENLVKELEKVNGKDLTAWAEAWVKTAGVPVYHANLKNESNKSEYFYWILQEPPQTTKRLWPTKTNFLIRKMTCAKAEESSYPIEFGDPNKQQSEIVVLGLANTGCEMYAISMFANYQDYGYGIFLLDDKSREYVLKNVQNEKDAFLRSMMYGALWDSVREGELDPRAYVEVAIKNLPTEQDETIAQMMLSRTATALGYYLSEPPAVAGGLSNGTTDSSGQSTSTSTSNVASDQPPATAGGSDLRTRFENVLIDRIKNAPTLGQRITFYRAFLNTASSENGKQILRDILNSKFQILDLKLKTKDKFDIVTRLAVLNDPDAAKLLAELEKTETSDDAKRYAYAARAAFPTKENRAKFWNDFVNNKDISESWIEAAFGPFNAVRNSEMSLPYLKRALEELPNHKRNRKIFFVNGWLAAFIGGQRSQEALDIVNKFLTDNPNLDRDLRLKILENVDIIERAVGIRKKFSH